MQPYFEKEFGALKALTFENIAADLAWYFSFIQSFPLLSSLSLRNTFQYHPQPFYGFVTGNSDKSDELAADDETDIFVHLRQIRCDIEGISIDLIRLMVKNSIRPPIEHAVVAFANLYNVSKGEKSMLVLFLETVSSPMLKTIKIKERKRPIYTLGETHRTT